MRRACASSALAVAACECGLISANPLRRLLVRSQQLRLSEIVAFGGRLGFFLFFLVFPGGFRGSVLLGCWQANALQLHLAFPRAALLLRRSRTALLVGPCIRG